MVSARMLTINSNPNNINEVESFLQSVLKDLNISNSKYPDILISLTEAVNNAIIHGNKKDETKVVQIDCKGKQRGVTFHVKDEGNGFDPDKIPDPTMDDRIECCGGRGVFIMSALADRIKFKNNGSEVEMFFKFP